MQEALKKVTGASIESSERTVTLCLRSHTTRLNGTWNWEMSSIAVYCSDVMAFPEDFEGTRGIIHPDDLSGIMSSIEALEEGETLQLNFRIITTYGEVKTIEGKRVSIDASRKKLMEPLPGKEPWEVAIEGITKNKELDFLQLRKELSDFSERLHETGTLIFNKTTAQAWYSDSFYQIYNLAPQTLNAHANAFNSFLHKEDRDAVLDAFEKAYEEQLPLHIEYRIVLTGGSTRYVQLISKWVYSHKGEQLFLGVLRDVTEERKLADELLAAQSKTSFHQDVLKLLQQQTTTGYWFINLQTKQASYSETFYRIYGVKHFTTASVQSFLHLVHADDRKRVEAAMNEMFNEKYLPEINFRIVRPDGQLRYLKQSARLFSAANKEELMIGVVQDATVVERLEKKVGELNEMVLLNHTLHSLKEETSGVSTISWLPNDVMVWSEGFKNLLGVKPGEVSEKFLYKSIHADDVKTFKAAKDRAVNGDTIEAIDVRLLAKTGVRNTKIFFRLLHEKSILIAVVKDVTSQLALQKEFAYNQSLADLVADSTKDILIFSNSDNVVLSWNAKAEEKTGISKEKALYTNLFEVLPTLQKEDFLQQLKEANEGIAVAAIRSENSYFHKAHDYWLQPLKQEEKIIGVLHIVQDVSKQLELQQQLSERLSFIESLIASSVDRIVALDRFMNYLYWNRKAEDYYGIQKEKVIGKNILEIFPFFRNDPDYGEFRKVLKGETVYLPATVSEDTNEYAETYLTPIKNEEGTVTAILWIVHDLKVELQLQQERETATKKIKEQAHYLQRITETTPDMISIMELETRKFTFLNAQTFEANGFNAKQIAEQDDEDNRLIIHHDDRSVLDEYFQKFITASDEDVASAEYRAKKVNGEWGWYLVRGKVFQRNEKGKVTHILNAIENITERKKAEEEVIRIKEELTQKATGRYKALFNSIDEGFCIIEVLFDENEVPFDYRFLEANDAFEKQTGLVNVIGKTMKELVPAYEQHWFDTYGRIVKTGHPERFENEAKAIGRYYEVYAFRVDDPAENRVAVLFNDISDRKKAEENFRIQLHSEVEKRTLELNQSKGLLQTILDHGPIGICLHEAVYNEQGEIMDFRMQVINKQLELLTGRKDLEGKLYGEEFPGIKQTGLFTAMVEALTSGQPKTMEYAYHHDGFDKTFVSMFAPWNDYLIATNLDISERKNAEIEIQKQLTLLRYTENMAQSGSWEYDLHSGRFTWSEGMYRLFGLPQQMKVQPEVYLDFAMEEDRSVAKRIVAYLRKKHQPFEEEMRIKTKEGIRLLRVKGSIVNNVELPQKMVGVDLDITNIKQAEEQLKESRHWLEQTAKASPDSITIYDLQKKQPLYLNSCLSEWIGISNSDLLNMGVDKRMQLIHEDDRLKLLHFNEKVAAVNSGEVITMEYRIKDADGNTIWLRNRSKPFLRGVSGKVTHILSILQNVTEEVELREQLKQRTQFAEAILDASVDRITVFDRNYRFAGWNKRCEQIHNKTRGEVIGKTIFEIFPGVENHAEFMNAQEQSLKGEFVHVPLVTDSFTGDHLELFYIPLKNESGETYAVVNVMHDISDYVLSTQAMDVMKKKLEGKNTELEQKNEEITSFAFVASHDMKEPLRKIHTFSDWLMQEEMNGLSPKGRTMVEKIHSSVHRMETLLDDILVLTKIHSDTHKEENIDLNAILKMVLNEMAEEISFTHTLVRTTELPLIQGNANQVFYLFKNLLSNAIKFQKPGSTPQISIAGEIVKGEEAGIAQPKEEYAKITITDNGFGFDQRYAKKIFQVFQRLHGRQEFSGTGIGLSICKKVMENHNGSITVKSEVGQGSVFNCFFPLH